MREGDLWIAFFMLYYGQSYRLMKDIFCRLLEDKIRRHKQLAMLWKINILHRLKVLWLHLFIYCLLNNLIAYTE